VLSFVAEGEYPELDVQPQYRPFASDAKPDATFLVQCKPAPDCEPGDPFFDSGGNWALHRLDGRPVIRIRSGRADPEQIVILEPDYGRGDINCIGEHWLEEGWNPLGYPLEELLVVNLLAQGRGVLLHASAVSDQGQGILFNGMSGAGKSTMATLWEGREGVTVLSDDRVIVREHDGEFWAYGTPWHGSARISSPETVALDRLFLIQHGEQNAVRRLEPLQAASRILARSFPPLWDARGMDFTLAFLERLVEAVPCYQLGFVPDESAVDFVQCVS
jgi:hypothetical protein